MVEPQLRKRSPGLNCALVRFHRLRRTLKNYILSLEAFGWHVVYFTVVCLIASLLLLSGHEITYGDALFLAITSATGAGLGNVPLSAMNKGEQAVVAICILAGGQVFIAALAVNAQRLRMAWTKCTAQAIIRVRSKQADGLDSEKSGISVQTVELEPHERYDALKLLSWLLPLYVGVSLLLTAVALGAWMRFSGNDILMADGHELSPWSWGIFNSISAFSNSGMSLLDANMLPFEHRGTFVVLVQSVLILVGNAAFPLILRGIISALPRSLAGRQILLDEQRAKTVFPYLFPNRMRWWLGVMLVIFNCINITAYMISAPSVNAATFLAALFQALSVRSGGFAITAIADLHISILLCYVMFMYISAFPVAAPPKSGPGDSETYKESSWQFIIGQTKALMRAGDLRFLAAAVFLICAWDHFGQSEVFKVVFEVASAYGCVGVSMGTGVGVAEVATWGWGGKAVLAAVMFLGRWREVRRGLAKGWGGST